MPVTLYDTICNNLESLSIKLNIPYIKPILITIIYRPSGSTVDLFPKLEKLLKSLEPDDTEISFMGDLNCDLFKTNDNHTKHTKTIYYMCKLRQMINQPTRVTSGKKRLLTKWPLIGQMLFYAQGYYLNRNTRLTHIKRDLKET